MSKTSTITQKYNPSYVGDPAITDGDLVKDGGDYQRNYGINNAIKILIGTNKDYWANLIENQNSKIIGGYEDLNGEAISSTFLERHSAKMKELLMPLVKNGTAKSIEVTSSNTVNDKVDFVAEIILRNGNKYFYNSEDN